MAITKFYKIIKPQAQLDSMHSSQDVSGTSGLYGNYTWYHRMVHGSAQRISRYREYDMMDNDVDVSRALDIIAEEMAGNNPKNEEPLELKITSEQEQYVASSKVVTLKAALKTFVKIHELDKRMFPICRQTIKYGDCFFLRPQAKNKKWTFCHGKNVLGAIVPVDDVTDVKKWQIKIDHTELGKGGATFLGYSGHATHSPNQVGVIDYDIADVIRFTLYDDMTDEAPFGESILRAVYRTFKQKELLEDALIIYRIQRAPERRVFYIDVGKTPNHLVATHLDKIRNEIHQKKIPTPYGGGTSTDTMYNPQSMSEDFFFAQRPDGTGSRVDVLPAGQNLGELQDLEYFFKKIWRGLRVPQSFMDSSTEGGAMGSDGKVGIAYMQEIKFSLYIERLQKAVERTLDAEFKKFLHDMHIDIDTTIFKVVLPEPSNYRKSRNQMMDQDLLGNMGSANGIEHLSKRFVQMKYGQLSMDEVKLNERMLREEKGLDPDGDDKDLPTLYQPDSAEAGGFEGGLGGSSGGLGGDFGLGDDEFGDDPGTEDEGGDSPDADAGDEGGEESGEETPGTPTP